MQARPHGLELRKALSEGLEQRVKEGGIVDAGVEGAGIGEGRRGG